MEVDGVLFMYLVFLMPHAPHTLAPVGHDVEKFALSESSSAVAAVASHTPRGEWRDYVLREDAPVARCLPPARLRYFAAG